MSTNLTDTAMIKKDRLRFTKNKLSANLTLLAIAFNALYFVSVYKTDVGSYYYRLIIGGSIVYNLLFMLAAFLSSEGVKNYKMVYGYVLIVIGLGQIIRIFILPMQAKNAMVEFGDGSIPAMQSGKFAWVVICLIVSAALCIAAGINAIIKTKTLESYQAELEKK